MAKNRAKDRSAALLEKLAPRVVAPTPCFTNAEDEDTTAITEVAHLPVGMAPDNARTLRMKKFRSQLLHRWLIDTFEPCRAADIGGGKGLVAYLLQQSGWDVTVIDPFDQPLPDKYKDITRDTRVKIDAASLVPRINAEFSTEMAADMTLLIGMHAHGSNAKIIDAAARYGCGFVIFPCCVIDEPFFPPLGVHWLESLASYASYQGLSIFPVRLNFKGQNIGLVHIGKAVLKK